MLVDAHNVDASVWISLGSKLKSRNKVGDHLEIVDAQSKIDQISEHINCTL